MSSPAGVPGPTRVSRSFSSAVSTSSRQRRLDRRGLAGAALLFRDLELVCRHSDDVMLVAERARRITAILDRVDRVEVHAAQRLDAEVTVGEQVLVLPVD